MGDEVLSGAALLVAVALAGEGEGALDRPGVDLELSSVAVLGDDREQVAEQRPLVLGQLLGPLGDRRDRALPTATGADAGVAAALDSGPRGLGPLRLQLACRRFRNRMPSCERARKAANAGERSSSLVPEDTTLSARSRPIAGAATAPTSRRTRRQRAAASGARSWGIGPLRARRASAAAAVSPSPPPRRA